MCGRYSIAAEPQTLEQRFQATFTVPFRPRYNAAPSQALPVILNTAPDKISIECWGLMPSWWQSKHNRADGLINIRAETLRDKTTFRFDLQHRRCLVIADGFYEWKAEQAGKVPFRIRKPDGSPIAFAGLWEPMEPGKGSCTRRFAIITIDATPFMQPIHGRMPVILAPEEERAWLAEENLATLNAMLATPREPDLEAFEVSRAVNNAKIDNPTLLDPVGTVETT